MAQSERTKPFRYLNGLEQGGVGYGYADLIRPSSTSESAADDLAATGTEVIYSVYSLPVVAKGDILSHDGNNVSVLEVGTNGKVLKADSTATEGITWGYLLTTKGDILTSTGAVDARLAVGTNDQVLMADSGQTNGIKWASLTTTKGDLLGHDGSDPIRVPVGTNGQALTADSTDAEGLLYKWFVGPLGAALAGNERDGAISCGSGTVTESTNSLLNYSTLDVGTGTYSHEANLNQIAIYATLITGNGGALQGVTGTGFSGTINSGGAASGGGAAGGAGGRGAGAMFIYAKEITGSGTIKITNASPNGSNGNNATVATTTGNGANGGVANIAATVFGLTVTAWHGGSYQVVSGGASSGTGGASNGSAGVITNDSALDDALWDWMAWLAPRPSDGASTGDINGRARSFAARNGLGGGAGGRNTGAQGAGGGGGAANCLSMVNETFTNGGSGNAGTAGAAGAGGGGGGGGGCGGFLCVWAMSVASDWTLTAPGGNGGNGGNGFGNGGGGGEGCGGPGGMVLLFTPVASSATLSAPAGSNGTKGTGGTAGTVAGSAPAGYTRNVVLLAA